VAVFQEETRRRVAKELGVDELRRGNIFPELQRRAYQRKKSSGEWIRRRTQGRTFQGSVNLRGRGRREDSGNLEVGTDEIRVAYPSIGGMWPRQFKGSDEGEDDGGERKGVKGD